MRARLLTAALIAGLLAVPAMPASAAIHLQADSDQAGLERATAQATALSEQLDQAWARDGGYRVALERLEQRRDLAQARLDRHVREIFTSGRPEPLAGLAASLAATGLRRIRTEGAASVVAGDRKLFDAVAARSSAIAALRSPAAAARKRLAALAGAALAAQERARQLLASEQVRLAAATASATSSATSSATVADLNRLVTDSARLAAASAALDQASAVVTRALTRRRQRAGGGPRLPKRRSSRCSRRPARTTHRATSRPVRSCPVWPPGTAQGS